MFRWVLVAISVGLGSIAAYAQIINPGGGGGTPGGSSTQLQFNTGSTFGGISGVTSDSANVGFATSSQLLLYGFTVGDCVKIGANNAIADFGSGCGGSGSPGGLNSQVQFNSNGNFAGISGATSDSLSIGFTTVTVNGNLTAGSASFTGAVSGTTAQFQTHTGTNIVLSGTATITASTIQLSGLLTASTGNFAGLTVQGLTGCVQAGGSGQFTTTGVNCATQTSTPSIAAGTNITTSGTAANTTVNVVATPSFTSVIATGNVTGTTGQFSGFLSAGGASLSGLTIVTATHSGNLTGTTAVFSGNLTGTTAQFSGLLTGTNAVFQTVTVSNLTPTGPNCLQETGGVLQATNVSCATQIATISIAAGNNITTSGTSSNITVTATPTGASNTVQFNNAGVFGGDSGFQYAGGTSGIVTHTLGNVTTTNARALSIIGTLSSSIVVFDAPLFANITTNAFAVGSKLVDIQATTISVFGVSPSGSINSGALQSAATQCLQASTGGLIFGTAVPCATQVSTPSIAAGTNITTSGTAANTTINVVATPSFTTVIATGNLTAGSAQFAGFLTAGGASLSGLTIQTATFSSNLTGTTANFSSNLTANIAQFAGFLSAGGVSLSGLSIQTETLSSNLTGSTAVFSGNLTAANVNITSNLTSGSAQVSNTASVGYVTLTNYFNWAGEARIQTSPLTITSAALTPTGLTVTLAANHTYAVDADLYIGTSASTGGIQMALTGTYSSAFTYYFGYVVDGGAFSGAQGTENPIRGAAIALTKTNVVGNTNLSGPGGYAKISGTVSVLSGGTLAVWVAQNTANVTHPLTITQGSRLMVHDMP